MSHRSIEVFFVSFLELEAKNFNTVAVGTHEITEIKFCLLIELKNVLPSLCKLKLYSLCPAKSPVFYQ